MGRYDQFQRIAEVEFRQIVSGTDDLGVKLRIYFTDKSYLDVFFSTQYTPQRYSLHWERRHVDKTFYRLNNTPDPKWKKTETFPWHFHSQSYERVVSSPFRLLELEDLFRDLMKFISRKIKSQPLPQDKISSPPPQKA